MKNIYLIGMSGCGKSTVGKILAKKINRPFADLDEVIINRSGQSIEHIFNTYGEQYFRRLESEELGKIAAADGMVVATGGGIIKDKENISVMKSGIIVFINTSAESIIKRTDFSDRPLIKNDSEKVKKLYAQRYDIYCSAADITVSGENDPDAVAAEILKQVNE